MREELQDLGSSFLHIKLNEHNTQLYIYVKEHIGFLQSVQLTCKVALSSIGKNSIIETWIT